MTHKNISASLIALITLVALVGAPLPASAQSTGVQKVLESAKATLDDLVTAKDDQDPTELPLRVKTLSQAISLSIEEAKDMRTKLDDLSGLSKDEKAWRDAKEKEIKTAIDYFSKKADEMKDGSDSFTTADVKDIATDFKAWRDAHYLPTLNEVRDYLLIGEQHKTIETATKRAQKIDEDVKKLEKARVKNIASARKLLTTANKLIADGKDLNDTAHTMFYNAFITPAPTSTATSSDSFLVPPKPGEGGPTSTKEKDTDTKGSSNASSTKATDDSASSTPPSIRDLVGNSSNKIKETYKIFIEMSNLVRRLLK